MNALIFSDSHGRVGYIDEMMARVLALGEAPRQILFLGDGVVDLSRASSLDGQSVLAVRGNCDLFVGDEPETRVVGLGHARALMMHGHTMGVKYGLSQAVALAVREGVDLLLYGHTHQPFEKYLEAGERFEGIAVEKPLCIFCPGALKDGCFGNVSVTAGSIFASPGNLFD